MPYDVTVQAQRAWHDLSLAQQAVWLDAKLSQSPVYQLGGWVRMETPLDEALVRQSVSLVMARHEGLRLRIDDELPRQWLDDSGIPPFRVVELAVGSDGPDAAFQAHVDQTFAEAMPLGDHPLFRIELVRAGTVNYVLWRFHHLIADSASVAITRLHWYAAYEALASGSPRELAAPTSYLRTVESDAAYLQSATYHRDLAYWVSRFEPMPPPLVSDLEVRSDLPGPVPIITWNLAGDSLAQFQEAARAAGTSVQRALFALFALSLGRRFGQFDIVSGVALHRRDAANRFTVGMMAGVIAVRCQFDQYWSLEECVQAFSEQVDADLRHQRLPVDILSRSLGLSGTGRAGLFEVAMSYLPLDRSMPAVIDGVSAGDVATKEASPISLHAEELADGNLSVSVVVNTNYFAPTESTALAGLLQAAIATFTQAPETPMEELATVTADERELVVAQFNQTDMEFATGTLDGLFSAQVASTPNALAVVGVDGTAYTYAELDQEATRVAKRLAIAPAEVVGVRMQRSAETIIALLAILKAGGIYLPLDPAYPSDRLEFIAKDAGAAKILTALPQEGPEVELPLLADPQRIAYIIYTSGTTGLPKGVAVPHAAAVNLAFARRSAHDPIGPGDRVLAAISVGFDVSLGQLLLPLLSGAAIVVAADLKTMGASEFWDLLVAQKVTHINSVPSFFDSILDAAPANLSLKRLMLGGEALTGALVRRLHEKLSQVEVVNMYGPTEACIDATYYVASEKDYVLAVLPIGRPLPNYQTYILDERFDAVGVGVTGELYLGGPGLALGYLNAPALTAERFIAHPYSEAEGQRLYRTGDRARWRADGEIEFLGRVDQQVKIRGFRVEPGEIANVLFGHPQVTQAVVVPNTKGGQTRLIAYVVPLSQTEVPDISSLRDYLAGLLPDYMIPSAFVSLAAIPLNRNGKLDVKALPSPDLQEAAYTAPRTPTEEMVCKLFAEVLGLERCGATDHFFELGGHSLLATSLVAKLRDAGMPLSLRAIFDTPTVDGLARRIDATLPSAAPEVGIVAQARPERIPLSFPQERIWFVDRLQQDASYNIPIAFELRGALHEQAVQQALECIVSRHEALRTLLVVEDGRPRQQVQPATHFNLQRLDLRDVAAATQEESLREALSGLLRHRFDLAVDLPCQFRLITLAPHRHVLAAVIHHTAFDGWSAGIFLREFATLYTAFSQQQPDPLPLPAIQYADFAIWQRERDQEADLAFWLEELQGAPARLELPIRTTPGDTSRRAQTLPLRIAPEHYAKLTQLAGQQGASPFMLLHAAFSLLLSRWSGQDDIVVGTVTANRRRTELESVIGCFVSTLALRTRIEAGESFLQLLSRVKSSDLAAYAHQDLPFERLVEALQPERSLDYTPIFQVMLVLQNTPMAAATLPGLELSPIAFQPEAAKFDLTLNLAEVEGGLSGEFEFIPNRLDPALVASLARQFETLLGNVLADPQQNVSRIRLLSDAEEKLVLEEWNRTEAIFPENTLDGLFAEQVRIRPEATAIFGPDGKQFSYAELDRRSTALARKLVACGVAPERVVGVRMERSAESIIALFAIWKAGGVYLPLDTAYPASRLDYMIENAGAMLVLESLDLDAPDAELPVWNSPDRLAYIIYTSGTTGQPKGVAVTHRAAVNLSYARRVGPDPIGPGDRVLAASSIGFDLSFEQLTMPLLCGATVVVAGDVRQMGAEVFWKFLVDQRVTNFTVVPSFCQSILDAAPAAETLHLQRLMLGGEALTGALARRVRKALPSVELLNLYGPTEASVETTFYRITDADCNASVLPIGFPLSNYQVYVLDANREPVGVGVAGELYVGGAGLAREYVGAPELTAQRFVDFRGHRVYRTGDRARWRSDGAIEFLGRIDEQVKIRGFRIEPGEIEMQLRRVNGVREAAVVADTRGGIPRLIAYYTGQAQDGSVIRHELSAVLPDYMVPTAFVPMERLPLTPNGKLDRKALPAPTQNDLVLRPFEAPEGETEQRIAALWCELLQLDRIGRHDNFFELGGHSLLAVTLVERLRQLHLPGDIRALFHTPTIAGLASASVAAESAVTAINAVPFGSKRIEPSMVPLATLTQEQLDRIVASVPGGAANVQDIYPLAPLQEGILFQHLMTATGDPYLMPLLLDFDDRARLDAFVAALEKVIARHDVLRTAMVWEGVEAPVQVVLRQAALSLEELPTVSAAALRERYSPLTFRLDLTKAPLLRAAATQAEGRWTLLLLAHHLILDHTSLEILVHELRTLMANPQADLPPAMPYRNFIAQTRSISVLEQEEFFRSQVGDVTEPTAPYGLLDLQGSAGVVGEARVQLEEGLTQRIRQQARAAGVTPATLFHLAWAAVLGAVSNKSDVVFGTVLFGRMLSGAGADRVVGMFINTLPMRLALTGTSVASAVRRTHELLADLMRHEHAPLALAQRASGVAAPAPLFSSLFNFRYSVASGTQSAWEGVRMVEAMERTNYPLSMAVDDLGDSFLLTALAPPDAYPERVCGYLKAALSDLLNQLEQHPEAPLEKLCVLPALERRLVLEEFNRTQVNFPTGTLDGLFAAQVAKTPHAEAVVGVDGTVYTYAQLDEAATRVASLLAIVPGQVVGVRMERSAETIIALLAILKAGGIYLPLDPAYPADRLEFIARDAGATKILTELPVQGSQTALPALSDPQRIAYIIYTSGTTGLPKGVTVPHAAAVNLAFARRAAHDPIGHGDRVLAAISIGFDVSIGQLLLPLLSGACIVVAGDLKTMGAPAFWRLLAERQVTHINSVPSFFDSILDAAPASLNLKRLMLGGESLSGALVKRLHDKLPNVEVVNMYGPTEACIDATYYVASAKDYEVAVLPIGRVLPNYTAFILNERAEPVGIGVTGELYLGGPGLATGYLNAPELTAARFVAHPFSDTPGERLYRTGDRARWRADGQIDFLGRVDQQVKIRGFRVEPGEVEAQLAQISGVREAAVTVQTMNGQARLIGYFSGDVSLDDLRSSLAAKVPDYMVPAAFVQLEQLPLTPSGKLDRKALPAPDNKALLSTVFEAPREGAETALAALWEELLKVDRIGRHDNFFELGGHSLLAVALVERMRRQGLPGDVRALFANPTIAGLAGCEQIVDLAVPENLIAADVDKITPAMLPLVKLTQAQIDRIVATVPGGTANVQDIYPLSPLQEGILFQHLMSEKGDPYLTPFVLGFANRPLVDRFLDALGQVIARHDVLRTAMVWKDVDEPVQVVWRKATLPVEEVALAEGSDASKQLMAKYDSSFTRIDLGQAPLLRAAVAFDSANNRWLLLLLNHHLILDHTSMEILVHELRLLMGNAQVELPASLPYRNFIAETRRAKRQQSEAFFQNMLADIDEPTAPFGMLDTQEEGSTVEGQLTLDSSVGQRLRDHARVLGVTPASLFHVAWAAVVGRISNQPNVVFGTVVLGRMRSGADAARVVGMFINTLPIRIDLDNTPVAESVAKTQNLLAELMNHEHTPLAIAQRASALQAPLPLFSSLFNYRFSPDQDEDGAWAGVELVDGVERTNYPLAMAVDDSGTVFRCSALARRGVAATSGADPERACQYLQQAVSQLLDLLDQAPHTPLASLNVMPDAERQLVVNDWNRTSASFQVGTLDGLFEEQVRRTPTVVAVIGTDGEELSYAQLDAQATRLARQLVAKGVLPGSVVGVRMERSANTVIAILAILKAGGVYLPLDPAYPSDRLAYMAEDAKAALVLDAIELDGPEASLPEGNDPSRLAYIIYTSGTTGKPKGVAVPHCAAVNLAFARRACHDPIGPGDRILAAISVGFDVSIGQLLLPLLSGATVTVAADLKTMSAAEFWAFIASRQVTHINSVPSFLDSILDAVPTGGVPSLKQLMLGGEALTGALVQRIWKALPNIGVVNMYGPTEACIDATYHVATEQDLASPMLPIGRPLSNYTAYVLDQRLNPVGPGISGELYLGGESLADGYINAPELTSQRFIPNPFDTGRLYRTGDRARWRADGRIEFLGRVDQQVKIRGFRVEPGEIAAALRQHPAISQAVVVPRAGRLVAYFVASAQTDAAELRQFLSQSLPDYMVPAAFISLDTIPLTRNGKLDVQALPLDSIATVERVYLAPRNAQESALQKIFEDVVGATRISVDDNFFEMGGDSLGVMRLINAINTSFGVDLPLRSLFQNPTIAGLAVALGSHAVPTLDPLVPLQTSGKATPLFCVHPAGGHVFCYLPLVRALGPNQPVYGLQASGLEPGEELGTSIPQMAAEYIVALKSVHANGPYRLLGMSSGGLLAFEMARQLRQSGQEVSQLIMLDTTVPTDGALDESIVVQAMAGELGSADLYVPGITLAELVERASDAGRLPAGFHLAQAERVANVFRNTVRAHFDYRPTQWSGSVTLARALRRSHAGEAPPDWSPFVAGPIEVVDFDCRHDDLVSPGFATPIAALVNRSSS